MQAYALPSLNLTTCGGGGAHLNDALGPLGVLPFQSGEFLELNALCLRWLPFGLVRFDDHQTRGAGGWL